MYDHLAGEHTVGVHPLLEDDTCHFLAVDFDEAEWRDGSSISWTPAIRRCCGCGTSGNVATQRWGTGLVLIHIFSSNHKKTILRLVYVRSPAMRYSSQVKPISYLKANAAEVLTHLAEQREPMVITQNGEAKAVLQDVASFEETQETLALLKILALGNQDMAAGKVKPVADVVARLRAKRAVV
jgi:prevent-host-death family protein